MESQQMIIHIGYHKCGSKYLQFNIFPNLNVDYIHVDDEIVEYCSKTNDFEPSALKTSVARHKEKSLNTTILSKESLSGHPHGYKELDPRIIANNLKSTYPNAKILIIIRNQFDYLTSLYAFRVLIKGVETRSFDKFLIQEGKRGLFDKLEYHNLISHYIDLFGFNNILVLPLEMLAKDSFLFNKKIGDFLEIDINKQVSINKTSSRENRSTRNKNIINFMRVINIPFKFILSKQKYIVNQETGNKNRRKYNKFKRKIVPLMNDFLGYNKQCISIPQEIEKQLTEKYKISNFHLQSMTNVDLSRYKYFL
jgi:hypothetical protein